MTIELSTEAKTHLDKLRNARDQIKHYKEIEDAEKAALQLELGDAHDEATVDGEVVVTWKYIKSNRVNQKVLKESFPDVAALCINVSESRRFEVKA